MKIRLHALSLLGLVEVGLMRFCAFLVICGLCVSVIAQDSTGAAKLPGTLTSRDGKCAVELRINSVGGAEDLFELKAPGKSVLVQRDVTGMAWVSNDLLAFTVSPIYGKPGVYVLDCKSSKAKRIVRPKTVNQAYPDGADYFELYRVSDTSPRTLFFYYAPDVDNADFAVLRTPANLFQVTLDGVGFKRAANAPSGK